MECRDARPLIARPDHLLSADERERLQHHLQTCSACLDEYEDPDWHVSFATLPMAQAPPNLVNSVIARLPASSPLEIAAHQQRRFLIYRWTAVALAMLVPLLALGGVSVLQFGSVRVGDHLRGLGLVLGLGAKALLVVLGQPWVTAVLLLTLVIIFAIRFTALARTFPPLLRSGMLTGSVLGAAVLLGNAFSVRADQGSILQPIAIHGTVKGDVSSLAGPIDVDGEVDGDVVSLTGPVHLLPGAHVRGSVVSAIGGIQSNDPHVDQAIINGPSQNPLAAIGGASTQATPLQMGWVLGMLASCVMLLFGAFVVVVWPQGSAQASAYLTRYPLRSFAFGMLLTLGLLGIAGGLSVVLAATIGGVLLVPVILLLLHLPCVMGVATVGEAFGLKLTGKLSLSGAIWGIAAQLLVVLAVGLLAAQGALVVFYLLASAGLGGLFLVRTRQSL